AASPHRAHQAAGGALRWGGSLDARESSIQESISWRGSLAIVTAHPGVAVAEVPGRVGQVGVDANRMRNASYCEACCVAIALRLRRTASAPVNVPRWAS